LERPYAHDFEKILTVTTVLGISA